MTPKPDPEIAEKAGHYDPCPEEWMGMENPRFTICEILREIYQATHDSSIRLKARIAMTMAKKMNNRLLYHKDKMSEEWNADTSQMRKKLS